MHRCLFWLAAVWVMAVQIVLAAEQGDSPSRLALLVGVGKYEHNALSELPGCPNDVADVKQLLTRYDFTEPDIKTLVNEQATHDDIVKTFREHLIGRANPQSTVVFYFSGHGSQRRDEPGGDETDGWDETICCWDGRSENKFDIADDEIAGLLAELRGKTRNVTVIFDSCHSGNATKGLRRARRASTDERSPPPRAPYAIASRGMVQRGLWDVEQYTFLSSCQSDQESVEWDYDNIPRGLFTYHLIKTIRDGKPGLTMRDALEETRAKALAVNPSQTAKSEGNLDRIPFGQAVPAPRSFFEVAIADDRYTLKGGQVHGVTAGSEFDVYAPGTKEFTAANRICQARVREVKPFTAALELIGSLPPSYQVARAVESKHAFEAPPYGVFVQLADTALQTAVKEAVRSVPGVAVTDDGVTCRWVITDASADSATGESIRVLDATKTVEFARMTPAAAGTGPQLAQTMRRLAAWLRTLELHNPTAAFEGEFMVKRVVNEDMKARSLFVPEMVFKRGEAAEFYVKNGSAKKLFIYVLDYATDGTVSLVFPQPGSVELIEPGGEWRKQVCVALPEERDSIIDVLKVVVTGKAVDFSPLLTEYTGPLPPEEPVKAVLSNHWAVTQRVFKVVR